MKLLKLTLTFFVITFTFSQTQAQQCGFDAERVRLLQDPIYAQLANEAEERIQNAIANRNLFDRSGDDILTIPVVVHVLHLGENVGTGSNISDAQIQSSIDHLNYFYRGQSPNSPVDFEIEFVLAKRDPNCNTSSGINRVDASSVTNYSSDGVAIYGGPGADQDTLKDLSRWPETDYFNIWIVTEINGNNGGSGYQGYANFYFGGEREGSVMMHTVFGYDPTNANPSWPLNFSRDNSTVSHEAGHYFHLFHTFQGDNGGSDCPEDTLVAFNNGNSDGCADTVPHRRETSTCPTNNSCTGNPWVDNNTINNIMSYYNCADRLTNDQKTRARATLEGTSLVNSKGSVDLDPSYAAPNAVCLPNSTSTFGSGIVSVELNGNTFASFSSGSDGGNIDNSANCSNYFEIDANVSNTINVGMFSVNWQQLGVWIDWNDDGDFDDDAEQQYLANDIAEGTTVPILLSYPSIIPYGDYVRVRLITEQDDRYGGISLIDSPCYTGLVTGQSEDYAIYIESSGPSSYVYDNGWLPFNPVGIASASDSIEIMNGDVTLASNTNCDTFTISANASVTIDTGATLTANTITLNSTSQEFSSLILNGLISGSVTYNRYVAAIVPVATNDLISSPLSGENFADFVNQNSNLSGSGTTYLFGPYSTELGGYQNYDSVTNAANNLESGLGYRAATTDGSNLAFTGAVLTTDVLDVPISDDENGNAWNLIGNPYPSYLDFDTFFTANFLEFNSDSAYQAIYGYDGSASNGWTVWNQATIDEGSVIELIAPGQGFFVKAKSGGGLVDFTTAMRTSGSSDDFISGRQPVSNAALCKLNLNTVSNTTSTSIYFIEGTTRGLDVGYDASTYSQNSSGFSMFSNFPENNTGLNLAIQTLPYNDFNDVVVPLGVNAEANAELSIGIDNISSLPQNIKVYLEDAVEQTLTLLNDIDYTFTPDNELNGVGRFYIRYSSVALSKDDNNWNNLLIYSTSDPKQLVVKGFLNSDTKAILYDIQGRLVMTQNLDKFSAENSIDASRIGTGIYIMKVFNDNQVKTQKLIIK